MIQKQCFIDAACWIALLNADDALHKKADETYKRFMSDRFKLITSTAVLNEVANSLSKPKFRPAIVEFHKRLQQSTRVEILFVNEGLWSAGWQLYEKRSDKEWSLTDCISMVIMRTQGIMDVLTNDRHFIQAGFNAILRY